MKSAAVLWMLTSSALAQPATSHHVNFYSVEREIALGRQTAAEVRASLPPATDSELTSYLASVGASLAAHADGRFPYSFAFFDDRKAWSLGDLPMAAPANYVAEEPLTVAGGAVFVPLSLLADAPNEATFAFQLAHAIAHIAERHATRAATRAEVIRIGMETAPVPVRGAIWPPLATDYAMRAFARASEIEADGMATRILAEAGYDPALVIPTIEAQPGGGAQSERPSGVRRAAAVRSMMAQLPPGKYSAGSGRFGRMKALAGR